MTTHVMYSVNKGGSRVLGKGGSDKYIHNWEGTGGGVPPPVTARGPGGALMPQPLFAFAFI